MFAHLALVQSFTISNLLCLGTTRAKRGRIESLISSNVLLALPVFQVVIKNSIIRYVRHIGIRTICTTS